MFGKKKDNNTSEEAGLKDTDSDDRLPRRSLISRFDILNRFKNWYMGGISITRSIFRVRAAWQGVIIISAILAILFILAAFYTGAGEFVISLNSDMSRDGFYLSNTKNFEERMVCIRGTAVVSADNISIFDISGDVMKVDGMHNGKNYVAHTFYLTNETGKTKDYQYTLNIRQTSKGAEKAMWVMVCREDRQTVYALNGAGGSPEKLYSVFEFPFTDSAERPEQYREVTGSEAGIDYNGFNSADVINKAHELVTVPFESDKVICQGERKGIKNKEVDKYTVVMWYEGEDPECTDEIIGGWVEVYMGFGYDE